MKVVPGSCLQLLHHRIPQAKFNAERRSNMKTSDVCGSHPKTKVGENGSHQKKVGEKVGENYCAPRFCGNLKKVPPISLTAKMNLVTCHLCFECRCTLPVLSFSFLCPYPVCHRTVPIPTISGLHGCVFLEGTFFGGIKWTPQGKPS